MMSLFGTNKVYCRGYLIGGPDVKWSAVSMLMVLIPSILWQVSVGSYFVVEYGPYLSIAAAILQLSTVVLMLCTAFADPGIVPRQKDWKDAYDIPTKVFRTKSPSKFIDIVNRGFQERVKWCATCNIYRPPRTSHCSVCDNCVERFDHHCPWLGNCIGKRNYWLFYLFVTSTAVVNVLVLATSIVHLAAVVTTFQEETRAPLGDSVVRAMGAEPISVVLAVYTFGIVWFPCGLWAYHNYLVFTNQTTCEQVKGTFENGNPYDRGCTRNFADVLLSKVRPRYLDGYRNRALWPRAPGLSAGLKQLAVGRGDHWQAPGESNSKLDEVQKPSEVAASVPPPAEKIQDLPPLEMARRREPPVQSHSQL